MTAESDRIDALKELLEQRFDAMDTALILAVASRDKALSTALIELNRRLDILNHAHERAIEVQHTYLPREVFDQILVGWEVWRRTVDAQLATRTGEEQGQDNLVRNLFALVGVAGTIFGILGATGHL